MPFGSNALRAPWSLALGMAFVATISILPYGQVLFSLVRSFLVRYSLTEVYLYRVLVGVQKISVRSDGPDPCGRPRTPPTTPPQRDPGGDLCSEKQSFLKLRNSEKKTLLLAADVCSLAKIHPPFSQKKSIVFAADVCSFAKK